MGLPTDEGFKAVQAAYDQKVFDFIRGHTKEILEQLTADVPYQSGQVEIPTIPIFDDFISGLEIEIRESLAKANHVNGAAHDLTEYYRNGFYYSALPNLSCYHKTR